jgi:hypothetical protein
VERVRQTTELPQFKSVLDFIDRMIEEEDVRELVAAGSDQEMVAERVDEDCDDSITSGSREADAW